MLTVKGKKFKCCTCGCNVFSKLRNYYKCNGCEDYYYSGEDAYGQDSN